MNSRLDELQAAFLDVKLKHLEEWNRDRNQTAKAYNAGLMNIGDLKLPAIATNCSSVYHIYNIRTKKRDALQEYLEKHGIGTLIHYPVPPHLQLAYKDLGYKQNAFPIAEMLARTSLSLPMYPGITKEETDFVCRTVSDFF
jgi:dTDP-4-amino-4,6-dideoxygalactose transaminase